MVNTKQKSSDSETGTASPRRPGVDHNYHDYSNVSPSEINLLFPGSLLNGLRQHNPLASGVQQQGFAVKLYYMLADIEASGEPGIVSWRPHGRCFMVHDRKAFVDRVLPSYFLQSNFASFQRQLNLYGFKRLASAKDKGGYYHELFLRGKPELSCYIQRMKKKGNGPRKPDSPESEPDFYSMAFLPPTGAATPTTAVAGPPSAGSCYQNQMMMHPYPFYDQHYNPHPADTQVLSLKKLLPATMQPPPVAPLRQQGGPPMLPYVPYPLQASHPMAQPKGATNRENLQPTPIAPRPTPYYYQWNQLPPAYSAVASAEPPRSSPEYMQQGAPVYSFPGYFDDPSKSENGNTVPEPGAVPKPMEDNSSATVVQGPSSCSMKSAAPSPTRESCVGVGSGRPMPPKPAMLEQRGAIPTAGSRREAFISLESGTLSENSGRPHSRHNSGTLSPASWNDAFGEGEEFWTWLK